jgi:hypothetical protein
MNENTCSVACPGYTAVVTYIYAARPPKFPFARKDREEQPRRPRNWQQFVFRAPTLTVMSAERACDTLKHPHVATNVRSTLRLIGQDNEQSKKRDATQ